MEEGIENQVQAGGRKRREEERKKREKAASGSFTSVSAGTWGSP